MREKDIDRIIEINRQEYGTDGILSTWADFVWLRDKNPAGQAEITVIRNDGIIGCIWTVPLRIRINGQNYLAATGTNLLIHPKHRNTFAYVKLLRKFEQIFQNRDIPLHFSFVTRQKYQQLQKNHPQTVSLVPLLVKPLDLKSLAQTYFAKVWQRATTDQFDQPVPESLSQKEPPVSGEHITIQTVDQFPKDLDKFWDQVQDKYPAMVVRDQTFLTWRFAGTSSRQYHILIARTGNQVLGYTVLRCSTFRGIRIGRIMDILISDSSLGCTAGGYLMARAEDYFRTQGMSLAVGLTPAFASEYHILRQAGYVYLPQTFARKGFRFAFFIHNTKQRALTLLSAEDWFITMADYELG